MKIVSIVGYSNSGKTQLIRKLILELKKRLYSVAVIKNCGHGFTLDQKGKDSHLFIESGADGVLLNTTQKIALIKKNENNIELESLVIKYFKDIDYVLVEGGREYKNIKKIEILRGDIFEKIESSSKDLVAVVSERDIAIDIPLFRPEQVCDIADFLENSIEYIEPRIFLDIDGISVRLNKFVKRIFENIILGMIKSLDKVKENPQCITLSLLRKERRNERN